jgi:hypothetical protein
VPRTNDGFLGNARGWQNNVRREEEFCRLVGAMCGSAETASRAS